MEARLLKDGKVVCQGSDEIFAVNLDDSGISTAGSVADESGKLAAFLGQQLLLNMLKPAGLLKRDGPCSVVGENVTDNIPAFLDVLMRRPTGTRSNIWIGGIPEEGLCSGFTPWAKDESVRFYQIRLASLDATSCGLSARSCP